MQAGTRGGGGSWPTRRGRASPRRACHGCRTAGSASTVRPPPHHYPLWCRGEDTTTCGGRSAPRRRPTSGTTDRSRRSPAGRCAPAPRGTRSAGRRSATSRARSGERLARVAQVQGPALERRLRLEVAAAAGVAIMAPSPCSTSSTARPARSSSPARAATTRREARPAPQGRASRPPARRGRVLGLRHELPRRPAGSPAWRRASSRLAEQRPGGAPEPPVDRRRRPPGSRSRSRVRVDERRHPPDRDDEQRAEHDQHGEPQQRPERQVRHGLPRPRARQPPRRARSSAASAGPTSNRSPTTNRSATSAIGRVLVPVDGDDRLGALHAHPVLHRPRHAEAEVQRGLHDPARLADLPGVRDPARVDRGARRTRDAAERGRRAPPRWRSPPALPTPRPPTTTTCASSSETCGAGLGDAVQDGRGGDRRGGGLARLHGTRRAGLAGGHAARAQGDQPGSGRSARCSSRPCRPGRSSG